MRTIYDTKSYEECIKYINDLNNFYIGSKVSYKGQRIKETLERLCRERTYPIERPHNTDSKSDSCSSVKDFGGDTLNIITKSPVVPPLEQPLPLTIFSSKF